MMTKNIEIKNLPSSQFCISGKMGKVEHKEGIEFNKKSPIKEIIEKK